jgi:hypothetical protein
MSVDHTIAARPAPTGGVDWASDNHAIFVVDSDGDVVQRLTVTHTAAGLRRMTDLLAATESTRWPSNAPTDRSSTPCSPRA